MGQGNKNTKRNLDRNPFWQQGFLGPDRYEPKDWSAVDASNKAWLNQEGYKGIRGFFNQGWNDQRMMYGPGGHLKKHQEIKRQDQLNKLERLKEEGHPWALKEENQKYYTDRGLVAPLGLNNTNEKKENNSITSNNSVDDGGRQAWLDATAYSPAAVSGAFTDEQRWQQQLKHRDWLASNNRGSKYTINNKDARYESAKAEALGNAGSQTLEQSVLGRPGGAVMGAAIGTVIAPGIGTLIGGGLGALTGNNVLLPEGQTQATVDNKEDGKRSVDSVQPVSGLEVGGQPNTKGFNAVSNFSQKITHSNQTGGFEGATGIGTDNMQPTSALTIGNAAGVEPANINGLDGNVDNPANDLVNQYKIQAIGDYYTAVDGSDPLKYFRHDTRSTLGNKMMGKN